MICIYIPCPGHIAIAITIGIKSHDIVCIARHMSHDLMRYPSLQGQASIYTPWNQEICFKVGLFLPSYYFCFVISAFQ